MSVRQDRHPLRDFVVESRPQDGQIESIFGLANNSQFFWELLIDDVPSNEGADSMQPAPGSTVLWQYNPVPQDPTKLAARTRLVHERRVKRLASKR